jgi:hypothetical protein
MFESGSITILLIFPCILGYCNSFSLKPIRGLSGLVKGSYHHQRTYLSQEKADGDNSGFRLNNKPDDTDIPPPPPPTGKGEWADWDTDEYIEEPYESEEGDSSDDKVPSFAEFGALIPKSISSFVDDDKRIPSYEEELQLRKDAAAAKLIITPTAAAAVAVSSGQWSPLSSGKKGEPMGMSASDNWAGWSEDAPYFDEDDSQDDEGNWGRSEGADRPGYGAVSGSSDLWTRQTPAETPSGVSAKSVTADIQSQHAAVSAASITAALPVTEVAITDVSSSSTSSSSSSKGDALTVVLEMNRQFSNLDLKMTAADSNNERRIGNLMSEIQGLKKIITFLIGIVATVLIKLLWPA